MLITTSWKNQLLAVRGDSLHITLNS